MPLLILSYLLQIACAVHAFKRGYPMPVIFLILAFPFLGSLIYVVAVLIPEWKNSRTARGAVAGLCDAIDPERDVRAAKETLAITDTVGNRLALADAVAQRDRPAEAAGHYAACLEGIYEKDPAILTKLAEARFAAGEFPAAIQALETLAEAAPEHRAETTHLLYARALAEVGETARALEEFETLAGYFSGPEAMVRQGMLLLELGRGEEARGCFQRALDGAQGVPAKLRERHEEWLELARRQLET